MKGSIYKAVAPNGRESWRYQVTAGIDKEGRRVRLSRSGFTSHRDAHDAMQAHLKHIEPDEDAEYMRLFSAGWVYFVETTDQRFVKIGYSRKPRRRISQFGTLRPGPFRIRILGWMPGSPALERWLHLKFKADRENGEWFHASHAIRCWIDAVGLMTPEDLTIAC